VKNGKKRMKTIELYSEKEVLMFHISGGGGNRRTLSFEGPHKITDCYDWDYNTFIHDKDDDDNDLPQEEHYLHDSSGHELMDSEDLYEAIETGIGRLDFDGDYDTRYTEYLNELSEEEYLTLDQQWQRIYQIVVNKIPEDELDKILEEEDLDYMFHYEYNII
jgi:hypothetical protein